MVDHNDVVAMRYVQVIVPSACLTLESTKEVVDETNTVSERRDRNALVVTVRASLLLGALDPERVDAVGGEAKRSVPRHVRAAWHEERHDDRSRRPLARQPLDDAKQFRVHGTLQ